jgi:hypothetical protein
MLDMLWRSAFRWKSWPRRVTGDSAYGTVENIAATEKAGIRAYMALKGAGQGRPSRAPGRDAPSSAKTSSPTILPTILSATFPLHLPGRGVPGAANAQRGKEPDRLAGEGRHLRGLLTEGTVHDQQHRKTQEGRSYATSMRTMRSTSIG